MTVPASFCDVYYCNSRLLLIGFAFCKHHAVSNCSDATKTILMMARRTTSASLSLLAVMFSCTSINAKRLLRAKVITSLL
jgi:hypothetical protein